jgi:hypothetical protein
LYFRASEGDPTLPPAQALHFGASGGEKCGKARGKRLQRVGREYSAPKFIASVGDALSCKSVTSRTWHDFETAKSDNILTLQIFVGIFKTICNVGEKVASPEIHHQI